MHVFPLLVPNQYNAKKRMRSTTDDFESHCFKKRLISTQTDIEPKKELPKFTLNNTLHMMDVNGTWLPMEQKSGESRYTIPHFILSNSPSDYFPLTSGPLVLYQKNETTPRITEIIDDEDTDSLTSSESDNEEFEPMELD